MKVIKKYKMKFLKKYFFFVEKEIKHKFFSSILNLLAIAFGILLIFCVLVISDSFQKSFEKEINDFGINKLIISKTDKSFDDKFDDKFLGFLKKQSFIEEGYGFYQKKARVKKKINSQEKIIPIFGIEVSEKSFYDLTYKIQKNSKKPNKKSNEIYLGSLVNNFYFDNKLKIGSQIYINNKKFKIAGFLEEVGTDQDDKLILIPKKEFEKLYQNKIYNSIFLINDINLDIYNSKKNLERILKNKYGEDILDKINILTFVEILESVEKVLMGIKIFLFSISFISLIIGMIGIINTMYVVIEEKIKEIGIMKSVGAKNFDILMIFILLSGIYGIFGSVIGLFFGIIILSVIKNIGSQIGIGFLEITINYFYIIYLIIFGFFIGCLAGYFPSKKASKISIIEAIRK